MAVVIGVGVDVGVKVAVGVGVVCAFATCGLKIKQILKKMNVKQKMDRTFLLILKSLNKNFDDCKGEI